MIREARLNFVLLAVLAAGFGSAADCLAFVTRNLARGSGNFFIYYRFADAKLTLKKGDVLAYDLLLDPRNPSPKGGIDADFADGGTSLRDAGLFDQDGVRAHGDGLELNAVGRWHTRRIGLDALAGRTVTAWNFQAEGDEAGRYTQLVADVRVERADGSIARIYVAGPPPAPLMVSASGYSERPALIRIDRSQAGEGRDLSALAARVESIAEKMRGVTKARADLSVAKKFLDRNPDPALKKYVDQAEAMLRQIESKDPTTDEVQAVVRSATQSLGRLNPMMALYTGHLVGHAHIDLPWLWQWQESVVAARDTFLQATKFMDEFPGFTFAQSSAALYRAIEDQYPDLFATIKRKVKSGQWEPVGGRMVEGDMNLISSESHARQFLYGQSYFRERFGKASSVGWEPDTFGHTLQMPQMLQLSGMDSYYFCRGGKGKPLFWWQGLDGTRVLAFDETATGGWYDGGLSNKQFQELLDFESATDGVKDTLWIYGVGNHGGGPTREQVQEASRWMRDPAKPTVRFSTPSRFFAKMRTYDLSKVPTIQEELNGVFRGVYSTHADLKRLNRDAESALISAEAVASVASQFGYVYRGAAFRESWERLCLLHSHDTVTGTAIHDSYIRTREQFTKVIADARDVTRRAMESLALRITPRGGNAVLVFNPTGWTRSGWVQETADGRPDRLVAVSPDGKAQPVAQVDARTRRVRFWAADVPAFGWRVFSIREGVSKDPMRVTLDQDVFSNGRISVRFASDGRIVSLIDKRTGRDLAGPGFGVLEAVNDNADSWNLGPMTVREILKPVSSSRSISAGEASITFRYVLKNAGDPAQDSPVSATYRLRAGSDRLELQIETDWNALGDEAKNQGVALRLGLDTALDNPTARYEIPFGSLARKTDGAEVPGLKWADLSDGAAGITLLNDATSGFSAIGSTLRATLIRATAQPDMLPNPGRHTWRFAIVPHGPEVDTAAMARLAAEFNQPLLALSVPRDSKGPNPLEWSFASVSAPGLVPTALKRAEDGNGFILRFYEAAGKAARGTVRLSVDSPRKAWTNLLEDRMEQGPTSREVPVAARPFEIKTLRFIPGRSARAR